MKVHIPAFEPMAKCNEHLKHGPIDIDLGPDVVKVVRCKDCIYYHPAYDADDKTVFCGPDDFCSRGQRREDA